MTDKDELKNGITEENNTENEIEMPADGISGETELDEDLKKAAVLAYAKYLKEHDLEPDEVLDAEEAEPEKEPEKEPEGEPETKKKKAHDQMKKSFGEFVPRKDPLSAVINLHDRAQDRIDEIASTVGKDFARASHNIVSTYQNTRRNIGMGILFIGILAALLLVVFDRNTVYEYAYNGKQLGYVKDQDEVTDVLDVAGREMTRNDSSGAKVEFIANDNVTFNRVDGRGKSTDDNDTVVNKLIYMSDIETEAFGVYDGTELKAVVKDQESAEKLLSKTKEELSTPDKGMKLVSSEFTNPLEIRPINVLLGSVQGNVSALRQMTEGGEMEVYHIVDADDINIPEADESMPEEDIQKLRIARLAASFGIDAAGLYDEDGEDVISEVEQGDIVCVKIPVEPVSVRMVEKGKIKEVIEYETIKKDSDEYYQGDTFIQQEGVNGSQIFNGTITKVAGEEVDRDTISLEPVTEKKDKIILIGTKERPKTAPTGTYQMPIKTYTVTSEWGGRWGRMHDGMDFGAPTGTPVYAADGGTIVRASYYGGYGNCIEVDHENGRMTRYAHLSRILVGVGDKVYQGQEIGLVGNTGNSFGSHLHFEVRINGASQNPRNYVNP